MSCDAQLAGKGECQASETLGGKLSKRNGWGIVWSKPRVNCPGKCLGKCTWECLEELSQERFGIYVQGDVRMTMQDYKFTASAMICATKVKRHLHTRTYSPRTASELLYDTIN